MMEQVLAVNGKPLGDRPFAQLMLPGQPSYELVVRRDELDRGLEGPSGLWEDSAQSARPRLHGLRPLLRSAERRLSRSEARRGLSSSPLLAPKVRLLPLSTIRPELSASVSRMPVESSAVRAAAAAGVPLRLLKLSLTRGDGGLGLDVNGLNVLKRVVPGSAAAVAGEWREGDVIVSVNGIKLGASKLVQAMPKNVTAYTFGVLRAEDAPAALGADDMGAALGDAPCLSACDAPPPAAPAAPAALAAPSLESAAPRRPCVDEPAPPASGLGMAPPAGPPVGPYAPPPATSGEAAASEDGALLSFLLRRAGLTRKEALALMALEGGEGAGGAQRGHGEERKHAGGEGRGAAKETAAAAEEDDEGNDVFAEEGEAVVVVERGDEGRSGTGGEGKEAQEGAKDAGAGAGAGASAAPASSASSSGTCCASEAEPSPVVVRRDGNQDGTETEEEGSEVKTEEEGSVVTAEAEQLAMAARIALGVEADVEAAKADSDYL
eukprot:Transcript_32574.p1 GENE.Transcript_32574~~Transcript_32574.p1  ORF type:complete len:493 (+),score=162.45 Transcript_32574:360-1838(+)